MRGFFTFLASRRVRCAVLHGGVDGFERELSDVDFLVDHQTFPRLPALIDAYCAQAEWQLCQILRHETTAAYFVCSAADDPSCAVALDACSDYQRNGTVFLTAEELLKNRQPLTWGGHGLASANELRYRFAKAAAKDKDIISTATEFSNYPAEDRQACETWLKSQWAITLTSWDSRKLGPALAELRKKSNVRPSLAQACAWKRVLSRILNPTGLIVITSHKDYDITTEQLERVFGHLYFRRFRKAGRWQPSMLKDLVASTLIVIPELGFTWLQLIPENCLHQLDHTVDHSTQFQQIALRLRERCKRRERI